MRGLCFSALCVIGLCLGSASARGETLVVFAAASLKSALDEAVRGFEGPVTLSYAGTPVLARQIDRGAPADVFIAASEEWMAWLARRGRIDTATQVVLFGNRLVVIGPAEEPQLDLASLPARLGQGRLAMALVDVVPAGQYGKAALQNLGLWTALAPQVAQADNVRAALALVATGFAPFGIVYATDAAAEPRVRVVAHVPADSHPAIRYPATVTQGAGAGSDQARAFLNFLQRDSTQAIFARHGFTRP